MPLLYLGFGLNMQKDRTTKYGIGRVDSKRKNFVTPMNLVPIVY